MTTQQLHGWFTGRVPDGWFTAPPTVEADNDEILVVGTLAEPEYAPGADDAERAATRAGRARRFREETREARMRIADEAERAFGRKVAWGVTCGGDTEVFTNLNVPVMTRLRFRERRVLDTLVEAGVARSRSEAMAWCVRLVGRHEGDWLQELRDALAGVRAVRNAGPASDVG